MAEPASGNLLLDGLSPAILRRVKRTAHDHALGEVLVRGDEIPRFAFFPHRGSVISVVRSSRDGSMVEAGIIGSEGYVQVEALLAEPAATGSDAIVQIAGRLSRIAVAPLRGHFRDDHEFRDGALAFTR